MSHSAGRGQQPADCTCEEVAQVHAVAQMAAHKHADCSGAAGRWRACWD